MNNNKVIIAITKNGINIAQKITSMDDTWTVYAPEKFFDKTRLKINWYTDSTSNKIKDLFENNNAVICIFSLGAVIRLIAPYLKSKKTDPAVMVIDDQANFVISVLSGHIGGANEITETIAQILDATPVITTAADVNKTIAVDLLGREYNWKITLDENVTSVSACMVNQDSIGVYQDVGDVGWRKNLPKNVTIYQHIEEIINSNSSGSLIITDKILHDIPKNSVVYRPPSLVVGIGIHRDTKFNKIYSSIQNCMEKFGLDINCIAQFASVKKDIPVEGLEELSEYMKIPIQYLEKSELAEIQTPNPSKIVQKFEGTASVSEAAALRISNGKLIVQKQKFPPDLTIAIARIEK